MDGGSERGDEGGVDPASYELELASIVEAFETARRSDDPAATIDGWVGRHPGFEEDLRELLPGLLLMESVAVDTSEAAARDAQQEVIPESIGDYRIVRRIGRGGMGVVYLAEQESLGREVALKVLPTSVDLDRAFVARFRREAKAAGRLLHPHIVPVFGAGFADGRHFFAMRHIDGFSLDDVLRSMRLALGDRPLGARSDSSSRGAARAGTAGVASEARDAVYAMRQGLDRLDAEAEPAGRLRPGLGVRAAVEIVAQVADAVDHAHSAGVLHRDIKPGNILLDQDGHAWVTDFGLCRMEDAGNLTSDGAILGTLRYMAPEQIEGASDERSDVYAVGLLLFELLALRPAFDSVRRTQVIHDVLHAPLPTLRRIRRDVPRTLETIVQKASAKLPEERYASAAALHRDLRAFLEDRAIAARPPSALYLTRLFVSRHKLAAAVAMVSLVMLATLAGLYVRDLRASRAESERRAYVGDLAAAEAALRTGAIERAKFHLGRAPADYRDWEWAHLAARADQSLKSRQLSNMSLFGIAIAPGGERVAVASGEGVIILSLPGLEHEASLPLGYVRDVSWSDDGARLLVPLRSGVLKLFERRGQTYEEAATASIPQGSWRAPVRAVLLDDYAVIGTSEGFVVRWDFTSGGVVFMDALARSVVSIGRLGDQVWAASSEGEVKLYEREGLVDDYLFPQPLMGLSDVHLEGGFDRGYLTTLRGSVLEFRDRGAAVTPLYDGPGHLGAVDVDGEDIVAVGRDKFVHLISRDRRREVRALSGSSNMLHDVAFVPGTHLLLTTADDGGLRLWDRRVAGGGVALRGHFNDVSDLAFDRAGRRLASAGRDGIVTVWDVEHAEAIEVMTEPISWVNSVTFAGEDENVILATDTSNKIFRWGRPLPKGDGGAAVRPFEKLTLRGFSTTGIAFHHATQTVLVATQRGVYALRMDLNLGPLGEPALVAADRRVGSMELVGDQLFVLTVDGELFRFDLTANRLIYRVSTGLRMGTTGLEIFAGRGSGGGSSATLGAGAKGVFSTREFDIAIFDPATGAILGEIKSRSASGELGDRLIGAAFTATGSRILATTRSGLVSVFDADDQEHLVDLQGHDFWAMRITRSSATGWVASAAGDSTVRLWHTLSTSDWSTSMATSASLAEVAMAPGVRDAASRDATIERVVEALRATGAKLPNHQWMVISSLCRNEPWDPELAAVYAVARARFSKEPESLVRLEAARERIPEGSTIAQIVDDSIRELWDVRVQLDALGGERSMAISNGKVVGARPFVFAGRSAMMWLPFLPWPLLATAYDFAEPLLAVPAVRHWLTERVR